MRRSPLIAKAPVDRSGEPGHWEWHEAISGPCSICGRRGPLERHHCLSEQAIRREGRVELVWDLRNAMNLGRYCACHPRHHSRFRPLPASALSAENLAFMVELLGEDRCALYVARYYAVA